MVPRSLDMDLHLGCLAKGTYQTMCTKVAEVAIIAEEGEGEVETIDHQGSMRSSKSLHQVAWLPSISIIFNLYIFTSYGIILSKVLQV